MNTIVFKQDFDLESNILDINKVDPEKDLGIQKIEQLPDIETKEQIEIIIKKKRESIRENITYDFVIGIFTIIIFAVILGYLSEEKQINNITTLV